MTDAVTAILSEDPRFVAGVREFNGGHFFEAHEIWEELWNDLAGDTKEGCQGLIQIAAGYHKLAIGNPTGARKLLDRGIRRLRVFDSMQEFVARVSADLETLRGADHLPVSPPRLPASPT